MKFNPPSIPLADIQDKSNSENILAGISLILLKNSQILKFVAIRNRQVTLKTADAGPTGRFGIKGEIFK